MFCGGGCVVRLERFREARLAGEKGRHAAALHMGLGACGIAENIAFSLEAGTALLRRAFDMPFPCRPI